MLITLILNFLGMYQKKLQYVFSLISVGYFIWISSTIKPFFSFDTDVYKETYTFPITSKVYEFGYLWLTNYFNLNGFTYEEFRLITFSCAYILLFISVIFLTSEVSLFFLLYTLFPFLNDVSNVRNSFMIFIVFFAAVIMQKKKLLLFAVLLITASSLMQTTGYLYLISIPLMFMPFNYVKKISTYLLGGCLGLFLIILLFGGSSYFLGILSWLLQYSSRGNINEVVGAFSGGTLKLKAIAIVLTYLFEFYIFKKYILSRTYSNNIQRKIQIMFIFVMIGMIGIPLIGWNYAFERILRNSFIFFIGAVSLSVSDNVKQEEIGDYQQKVRMLFLLIIILIMCETLSQGYFNFNQGNRGFYIPYMLHLK